MIKVLNARPADTFKLEIDFSDHTQGVFDAGTYLSTRSDPPVVVRRRFGRSLSNFFTLYAPLADEWTLFDNSTSAHALPVATQSADQLTVTEAKKWRKLQRLNKAA